MGLAADGAVGSMNSPEFGGGMIPPEGPALAGGTDGEGVVCPCPAGAVSVTILWTSEPAEHPTKPSIRVNAIEESGRRLSVSEEVDVR